MFLRTDNAKELGMKYRVKMEEDFAQTTVTVDKSGNESYKMTGALTGEDNDSVQNIRIKTESETNQVTDPVLVNQDEFSLKLPIKTESIVHDCPGITDSDSEFSTKCTNCEHCFTDYLQYLDHKLLCVAGKIPDNRLEVKTEANEIAELYSNNTLQSGENVEETETLPGIEKAVYETNYKDSKCSLATEQHDTISKHNIPTQAVPQLLIQNRASKTDMLRSETQAQEILITCFYCNEPFLQNDRVPYMQHVQKHLNKVNKVAKTDVENEIKILNDYFRNVFTNTVEIFATVCRNGPCNFIFVDKSASEKHYLMVHQGYQFVCNKVDCHKVFPDKGSLRSHEIVDHTKVVQVFQRDALNKASGNNPKPASIVIVSFAKAKSLKSKKNVENACGMCGKKFPTSVALKSHMICNHSVMSKQCDNLDGNGAVSVAKGVKEDCIKNDYEQSRDGQADKTSGCDKDNSFKVIHANMEYSETHASGLQTCNRMFSPVSGNSLKNKKELMEKAATTRKAASISGTMIDQFKQKGNKNVQNVCLRNKNKAVKMEHTLGEMCVSFKNAGEDFDNVSFKDNIKDRTDCSLRNNVETKGTKRHSSVRYKTFEQAASAGKIRKTYKMTRQSNTMEMCAKNGTESGDFSADIGNSLGKPENKRKKLNEPDYLPTASESFAVQNKVARKFSVRNKYLAVSQKPKDNQIEISAGMNKSCKEVLEKNDDITIEINDIPDAAKYMSDIMDTDTSQVESADNGKGVWDQRKNNSKLEVRNKREIENIGVTGVFGDMNVNNKNDKQHDRLKGDYSSENVKETESLYAKNYKYPCILVGCHLQFCTNEERVKHINEQHVDKVVITKNEENQCSMFPCKSKGCKHTFLTSEERRKHVEENHMAFDSSENVKAIESLYAKNSKYPCILVGCHLQFCTNEERVKHINEQHVDKVVITKNEENQCGMFPCKSKGCKLMFLTSEERRKHVEENHMAFDTSLIKFKCTTPGCFKGFYRRNDLLEHSRNCTNVLSIKSRIISSDNSISASGKMCSGLEMVFLENTTAFILSSGLDELKNISEAVTNAVDESVKGNLYGYYCPISYMCNYGSKKKSDIFEHLKSQHNLDSKKECPDS
ncbi:uncharacterized protein LOC128550677 [Mercenaria mercenaria]|uniref:uncharacterized protein LOC128550677 n=1 Tax=Mercenaria mercenaria TaxID=6596 RepID=UPI00234E7252|nr:uncharacterized protein LOC128550677 [Mercenaria mercenaria]